MGLRMKYAVTLLCGLFLVSSGGMALAECPDSPDHFTFASNTGCTYSLVIQAATIGGVSLEAGDEIGVFDGDLCVGAACWTDPLGLTAWCDDTQTASVVDGYVCGNAMSFKIWDNSAQDYCDPAAQYSIGDGTFCFGGYSILTLACEGEAPPECSVSPTELFFNVDTIGGSDPETFTIENIGGGMLEGTVLESCDEFEVTPTSYSLGAGELETFTVTYTPQDCGDDQCEIDTDTPCDNVFCDATGPDMPECFVDPIGLSFIVDTIGGSDVQTFTITNVGCGQLMGDATELCDEFDVVPGTYDLGPGQSETFTVTYTPQDCGDDQCEIDTDTPCDNVFCDATGPDMPECFVDPIGLSFIVDTIGGSDVQTFTITNVGCGQLMGDATELCDEFDVVPGTYDLGPGQSETFTVTYTPQDCGDDQCEIDTDTLCDNVFCEATGPVCPGCSVEPQVLTFSVDTVGLSESKTFTITNIGGGTLAGTVSETCDEFTVDLPSYNLGPGEFQEFTVTYAPEDEGDDVCVIETDVLCNNVECQATGPECIPSHFQYSTDTDETYGITITSARIGARNLQPGDEVGVFDGSTCVGAVCWSDPPVSLLAWINTDQCDNPMYFKVWDSKTPARQWIARAFYTQGDKFFCTEPAPVVRLRVHQDHESDLGVHGLRGRPNPLNPDTDISYALPEGDARSTSLRIYNPQGQLVRILVDGLQSAGEYTIHWNGTNNLGVRVSSGIYFCVLRSGEIHDIEKLMVVK